MSSFPLILPPPPSHNLALHFCGQVAHAVDLDVYVEMVPAESPRNRKSLEEERKEVAERAAAAGF